jgi:hypothetical protein
MRRRAAAIGVVYPWPICPLFKLGLCLRRRITTSIGMPAIDLAPYFIHATDPANAAQVEYECLGFTLAHEKAVELRKAGFKNVVLPLVEASDGSEAPESSRDD